MYGKSGGRGGARPLQRRGRRPTPTYGRSFHSPRSTPMPTMQGSSRTAAMLGGLNRIIGRPSPMKDNPWAKAAMTKTIIDPETGEEIEVDLEQAEEALREGIGLGSLLRAKGGPAKKKKKKSRKKPRGVGKALRGYGRAMK